MVLEGLDMLESLCLLIVDDQPRTRQSLRALLSANFHPGKILEAENGLEALAAVQTACPDLVILDAKMAVLDGIEATRQIKAGFPQVKVLVLSLYPRYQAEALAAGADAFLTKDEQPERLLAVLADLLN